MGKGNGYSDYSGRIRSDGLKVRRGRFRLGVRMNFFSERAVLQCTAAHGVVGSPSMEVFRAVGH